MEVIDFKDLMKEERFVPVANQDASDGQNKSLTKSFVIAAILCIVAIPLYFFIRFGGGASEEGSLKYHGAIGELFSSMQSQYPNFKSVTCTEGNPKRNDCIKYTFVFFPHDDPDTVGTVMSTVDKAYGVSDVDLVNLKATIKQMVEFKHQYIYGRRAPLTVLILSSNMSRGGVIEETKMECVENGVEVECKSVK